MASLHLVLLRAVFWAPVGDCWMMLSLTICLVASGAALL